MEGIDTRDLSDRDLAALREDLDKEMASRGEKTEEAPRGYGERNGKGTTRRKRPTQIEGVLFQVRVPVGRRGETMPAYLLFPPVRDERELEDLANDVEREYKLATVYPPKGDRDRSSYNGGGGGYNNRDRGGRDDYRGGGYNRDRGRDRY